MSLSSIAVMRWMVFGVMWTRSPGSISRFTSVVAFLNLEEQPARVQVDRLVLQVVILEAEGVAGVDVNQLADVAIRLRPVQLVAPRLLDTRNVASTVSPVHGREPEPSWRDSDSLDRRCWPSAASSSCSISSTVASRRTRRASARRSSLRTSDRTCFATPMAPGVMLNSVSPRPTSSVSSAGSDAISPQSDTGNPLPRRRAAHHLDHPQNRRMQRLVQPRHALVGAIDGQAVLNQIVGADGEEVDLARQQIGRVRRGRNLDHDADRHVRQSARRAS